MRKNILGLDLGTNSIGWAVIEQDFNNKEGKIKKQLRNAVAKINSSAYSLVVNCLSRANLRIKF